MKFADIPGHDDVKARLRQMRADGRIPHAILFEGPAGSGKFALARAFAQYIHCTDPTPEGDSCGRCQACRQHETFNHIDTYYTFPVVKRSGKAAISDDYIEDFRGFMQQYPYMDFDRWLMTLDNINAQPQIYVEEGNELLRRMGFMARQSQYKIVLMWLPERLKEETANKLLKLIEEPHGDTIFLMVTNNSRGVLGTIYSRTQRVAVRRYTDDELVDILIDRGIDADTAADLARIAEGNVNTALAMAEVSKERVHFFDLFVELMRKAYARKVGDLRAWANEVAALGREPIMQFVDYCTRLVRESFLMHLGERDLVTLNSTELAFTIKFFPFIHERNVAEIIELFDRARRDIASNGNAKIVFFDLAVRTIILIKRPATKR